MPYITITEYWAGHAPRVTTARKFEVVGPYRACHHSLDMSNAEELCIRYVKPRKRNCEDKITLLRGTARGWNKNLICYDNYHFVRIERGGGVLFDSREVFPCDMQEFAKEHEAYQAKMVARGFSEIANAAANLPPPPVSRFPIPADSELGR
jgi:hypothetical protein